MDRLIKAAKEYLEATARDPLMASQQYYRDELAAALAAAEAIPQQPKADVTTGTSGIVDPNAGSVN